MQVSDSDDGNTNTTLRSTSPIQLHLDPHHPCTVLYCLDFPALSAASPVTKVLPDVHWYLATHAHVVCKRPGSALLNLPSPVCRTSQAVLDAKLARQAKLQVGAAAEDTAIRHMGL